MTAAAYAPPVSPLSLAPPAAHKLPENTTAVEPAPDTLGVPAPAPDMTTWPTTIAAATTNAPPVCPLRLATPPCFAPVENTPAVQLALHPPRGSAPAPAVVELAATAIAAAVATVATGAMHATSDSATMDTVAAPRSLDHLGIFRMLVGGALDGDLDGNMIFLGRVSFLDGSLLKQAEGFRLGQLGELFHGHVRVMVE